MQEEKLFARSSSVEDDLKNVNQNYFFSFFQKIKKQIFFLFFGKNGKKYFLVKFFFLVIFRGRRPMEDDLAINFTSLMLVLAQYNFYSSKL